SCLMNSQRLEAIKQNNPRLWQEIREYFSPAGLRRQIADYRAAAELAEAKAAALQEGRRLADLKRETTLLESRNRRLKQQQPARNTEKVIGSSAQLMSDAEVQKMYDRWR